MARPRKTLEEKRAAKARYAREHARSEYPEGLVQALLEAPVSYGGNDMTAWATSRLGGSLGSGCRWKTAVR